MKEASWSNQKYGGTADELDRLVEAEITLLERHRVPHPAPQPQAELPSTERHEDGALTPEEMIVIDRVARWLRNRPDPALLLTALSAVVKDTLPAPAQSASAETEAPPEPPHPKAAAS